MSESIYNLVPREYVAQTKIQQHKSKHNPNANLAGSTFGCFGSTRLPGTGVIVRKDGAIFGPSGRVPSELSKMKTAGEKALAVFRYEDCRKDRVPSQQDRPVYGINTHKNFIVSNAVEAILQVPKKAEGPLNYAKKSDFGKVPEYLAQVKDEIKRENEMIERYVKEQMGDIDGPADRYEEMSEDERQDLLLALKEKWVTVNAQYQKITHLVQLDTTGQVRRKEQLEKALSGIENDIQKLSRSGPLLIRK